MTSPKAEEPPDLSFHPNLRKVSTEGGAACFMSQTRVCGPDCMAYLPQVPEGKDFTGEQWAHCMLLVNAHRAGKHLVILANVTSEIGKEQAKSNAAATRSQRAPGGG